MNIRNFCFFPMGSDLIPYFQSARHLWLPLEQVKKCSLEMDNPCIVFNISIEETEEMRHTKFFFEIYDERWKDPFSYLPVEAISRAYAFADKAIEWAKEQSSKYSAKYEEQLALLLKPNRTGYSRWMHRCLLYGGLLEKYRQSTTD